MLIEGAFLLAKGFEVFGKATQSLPTSANPFLKIEDDTLLDSLVLCVIEVFQEGGLAPSLVNKFL